MEVSSLRPSSCKGVGSCAFLALVKNFRAIYAAWRDRGGIKMSKLRLSGTHRKEAAGAAGAGTRHGRMVSSGRQIIGPYPAVILVLCVCMETGRWQLFILTSLCLFFTDE